MGFFKKAFKNPLKTFQQAMGVLNPVTYLANVAPPKAVLGAIEGSKQGGGAMGALTGALGGGLGAINDFFPSPPSEIPTAEAPPEDANPPAFPAPGVTTLSDQKRKRRIGALRQGILSTIRSSPTGDTSSANLLTPTATGLGIKTLLGQ